MRKRGLSVMAAVVCVLAVCAGMAAARGKTFKNSGFEKKTFAGWQTKDEALEGAFGRFVVYKGSPPISDFFPDMAPRGVDPSEPTLRKPRRGKYAASSLQNGPGTRLLFRSINLRSKTKRKVAFLLNYQNFAPDFVNPTPDSLHAVTGTQRRGYSAPVSSARGIPTFGNQQYRVDVLRKGADPYSIDDADVLKNLIKSRSGDPANQGWKRYSFGLSSLPAGKAKLRVAEADTNGFLLVGFDALKLEQTTKK